MRSSTNPSVIVDQDLFCCLITQEICRYPVMASDGRHYELGALLAYVKKNGLVSPYDRSRITFVTFDLMLESTLDLNPSLERYNYDDLTLYPKGYTAQHKKADMEELQKIIAEDSPTRALQKSIILTGVVGAAAWLLHTAAYIENPVAIPHIAIMSGFFDFQTRYFSNHRFGIFGFAAKAAKSLSDSFHAHLEEEIHLYEEMLGVRPMGR